MDTGKEKIQKICDTLRRETIEPAKQAAQEIIENANLQAVEILAEAQKKAEEIVEKGNKELEHKRKIFESTIVLASNKTLADLKQKIENRLFNQTLKELVVQESSKPQLIAELIMNIIRTIEKEGLDSDLSVYLPKGIPPKEVNAFLLKDILEKIREKDLLIGDFDGGVKIKLHNKELTIDLSGEVLREAISAYLREDFRKLLFNS